MQEYSAYFNLELNELQFKIYEGLTSKVDSEFNDFLFDVIETVLENLSDCLVVALNCLVSPTEYIKLNSLSMIEYILDNNKKDLGPNLKLIATTLNNLFKSENELDIRKSIIQCTKALIISAKESISPYYSEILCYSHCLLNTTEETLSVRCAVLSMLSHLFAACPANYSYALIGDFIERAFKYLESDCIESRNAAFIAFSSLLPKFQVETGKYADMLIDEVISSGEISEDSDYEDPDAKDCFDLEINEAIVSDFFIDEKCSAVYLVARLVKNFPHKAFDRIHEIENFIDTMIDLNDESISKSCIKTSYRIVACSYEYSKNYFTNYWNNKMLGKYTQMLISNSSIDTVNAIIKAFTKLIKKVGESLIPKKDLKSVFESISVLINNKAECQERSPERQRYLFDILSSLIYELAVTKSIDSFPYIDSIISSILTHPFHISSPADTSGLIATLAEQIQIFPKLSRTYYTGILNIVENIINKQQDFLYWNTVYLIGVLCENEGNYNGSYEFFLNFMTRLLEHENSPGLCDNICAALCRMVIGCYSAVPAVYNEIILDLLPIKQDFSEIKCVFKYISFVLDHQDTNLPEKFTEMVLDTVKKYENNLETYKISASHYANALKFLKFIKLP